ncbi:MAG: 6-phosphogluconolactonase [Tepidisphaeraceae bacterium]|jgi:6-phosphogluconolactonase
MTAQEIQVVPDASALAQAAAEQILAIAPIAARERGVFSIALSGGSTPKILFELLASDSWRNRFDWNTWEIYFGDERCVPPDHPDSNYRMARLALLDRVPLDPAKIHRMKGEADPQEAAKEYGQLLKQKFGDDGLDLILLGMGDDGHTASLFPGTAALAEKEHRCVANFVPKLGVWRLTFSAPFINRARQVIALISGAAKAQRLERVLQGPRDPTNLPIQMIQPTSGKLLWLLDAPAAGMMDQE